ncbi:MAG: hypothetical protein IT566_10090 [Rhodospirillaceae bacterium]|nr:hypothetical protein [Rhodospirillaceae bacterium]
MAKNWAKLFEMPRNNMRARVVWRLYRMGQPLEEIAAVFGVTFPAVWQLREMYMNRANDWRDRVPGAKR